MSRTVISPDVPCPWCGAQAGEACHESDGRGGKRDLPPGRGHLARVEEVAATAANATRSPEDVARLAR